MRLSASGLATVELDDCDAGYVVRKVEIAPPEVRDVVSPRPLVDGTIDRTRYSGSRNVTLDLMVVERPPVFHAAVTEPRASLRVGGAGWITITEPLPLYPDVPPEQIEGDDESNVDEPTINPAALLDLRVELALDHWTGALQIIAAQYADGDAGWLFAIDPLGRVAFVPSINGRYFDLPGTNLLPNPSVETDLSGYVLAGDPPQPRNLLYSDQQASIEAGPTEMTAGDVALGYSRWSTPQGIARDPATARHGTSSLVGGRLDGTAGALQLNPMDESQTRPGYVPVEGGKTYTALASAWVPPGGQNDYLQLAISNWYDADRNVISSAANRSRTPARGAWTDARLVATAPEGAVYAVLLASMWLGEGEVAHLDRVGVFEGDVSSGSWSLPSGANPYPNLLSDAVASFEDGTVPAELYSSTGDLSVSTAVAAHGTHSLAAPSTADNYVQVGLNPATATPVTPGVSYTSMAGVYVEGTDWTTFFHGRVHLDTAGNVVDGFRWGTNLGPLQPGWNYSRATWVAPEGAAYVCLLLAPRDGASAVAYLDKLGIYEGADVPLEAWSLPMVRMADSTAPEGDYVILATRGPGDGDVEVRTEPIAAQPGAAYFAAVVVAPPEGRTITGMTECLDAEDNVLASNTLTRPPGDGTWATMWGGEVAAPEGTTAVRMRVRGERFAAGESMRLDAFELVDTSYTLRSIRPVPFANGERTALRMVIDAESTSAYYGPSAEEGPWTPLYVDLPRDTRMHESSALITVGAVELAGEGAYGLKGNVYAGAAYAGGERVISWDGYTITDIAGFPFTFNGDAETMREPGVILSPAWTERFDSRRTLMDRVAPYLRPDVVSTLTYATDPEAPPRRIRVRGSDWSAPWKQRWHLDTTLGFVTVGQPWALGEYDKEIRLAPGTEVEPGRTYSLTFDRTYPSGGASSVRVVNAGSAPAEWVATVYGP
ncbi:hypothetical protein, partial [Mumia sp.]|uniref:hypothetical protein n=1 Tax=Mumia sp. TaxID=1965300 RepID=UPI0026335725